MIASLLKILVFFFVIYIIYNFIRGALSLGSRKRRIYEERHEDQTRGRGRDRVIELDKDQYKVE